MKDHGWDTIEVEQAQDCPDSVFVEDTMVVYDRTAVIARPGADTRRPETARVEDAVSALGYQVVRIEAPGTLDGGDVLKVAGTVYVGAGGWTNGEGIRQLRSVLAPLGATVVGVPLTKVLHLKSAVTALPDGTIIGYPPLVDELTMFPHFLVGPRGVRCARRAPGRRQVVDVAIGPSQRAAVRGPGLDACRCRHQRVREARGVRDVLVGPAARARLGRW